MLRRLRLLLALALIAALPLQGIAAVKACFCPPTGHHDHEQTAAHDGDHQHSKSPAQSHHCGPCAACCAVAVVGSVALALPLEPASTPPGFALPAPATLRLDTPERPPLLG